MIDFSMSKFSLQAIFQIRLQNISIDQISRNSENHKADLHKIQLDDFTIKIKTTSMYRSQVVNLLNPKKYRNPNSNDYSSDKHNQMNTISTRVTHEARSINDIHRKSINRRLRFEYTKAKAKPQNHFTRLSIQQQRIIKRR